MNTLQQIDIAWQDRQVQLEYQWVNEHADAPLLLFLHEGLGSISMWRDWPARLCEITGCRGLVYSRYGYGNSSPRPEPEVWPVDYLHQQAWEVLPAFLAALNLQAEKPIFIGHSDGGSISLLYASRYKERLSAAVVMAPHLFVEPVTLRGIVEARQAYLETPLRARLSRYHRDVDSAFWGWNKVWLNPEFKQWNIEPEVAKIQCPILAMQGDGDEYGTLEQIQRIQKWVPHTELCVLENCGHSPHREQESQVNARIHAFIEPFIAQY